MAKLHTQLQTILNNYTETGIADISEEAGCLMLELSSAIADDLDKSQPFGTVDDFTKMTDINDVRSIAQELKQENLELKKNLQIQDYFKKMSPLFHPRDHARLMTVAENFIEKSGRLDINDTTFLMKNGNADANMRAELESIEIEKTNRLLKLGNIKTKIKK